MQGYTLNQVEDLEGYNLYNTDPVLREAVQKWSSPQAAGRLEAYGKTLGTAEVLNWGSLANRHPPQLQRYTRLGAESNRVDFHESWHSLMRMAMRNGLHSRAWLSDQDGAQVERAAAFFMHGQVEAGSLCPLTMTSAALPVLMRESWFASLEPHLRSQEYDSRNLPIHQKNAILIGMGLTERQGGSDLRNTQTVAEAFTHGGQLAGYKLTGEKWFYSVPTADAHLVLARSSAGLSCFFVPRINASGQANAIHIRRLKDKLGNRSSASAEVEFHQAEGVLVGEEGRGLATLMRMAGFTRLDCVLGSAALMRQALVQALHHAQRRTAFNKHLIEHPLMMSVLVAMALESEAATLLSMRLAHALEQAHHSQARDAEKKASLDAALVRVVIPAAKFWVCKRAQQITAECLEVWGGNGYIEDSVMPRLYREAPVNSIWEGSANIMCLESIKAIGREPELGRRLLEYLGSKFSQSDAAGQALEQLQQMMTADEIVPDSGARRFAQLLVLLVQAALLRESAPELVSQGFEDEFFRLSGQGAFGLAELNPHGNLILERYWPY